MTLRWRSVHVHPPAHKPLQKFDRGGLKRQRSNVARNSSSVFPTRSPVEIARALLTSQTISILEMNVILQAERDWRTWDANGQSHRIAMAIGHILGMNQGFYNDCIWRALYSRVNPKYFFPVRLVDVLFQIKQSDNTLFKALYREDFAELVRLSLEENQTPHQLLKQYNLPLRTDIFLHTIQHAIDHYLRQASYWQLGHEKWLIDCLKALLIEQRHQSVNHLLAQMTKDTLTQLSNLQQQLYQWYPQRSQAFGALSAHSQEMLQLFDILRGWNVFELFTEKMFGYRVRDVQSLFGQNFSGDDKRIQARHALSRMGIWSNYTSHMEQMTFFVPKHWRTALNPYQEFRDVDSRVFQYADIATPCLIFHIANVTIVQYLWSPHRSTVREYGHAIAYQQLSMLPAPNEVYNLREIHAVKCYAKEWQKHLYEFIRDKLRLRPNDGWTEFRGYPKKFINSRTGLPQ